MDGRAEFLKYYGVNRAGFTHGQVTMKLKHAPRLFLCPVFLAGCLAPSAVKAQAVWTNADDRDYSGTPPVFVGAYWSYGYVAPDKNSNSGHPGNWSGNLAPGLGGPLDVYLGAPGNTICDVVVTLNSLTIAPGGQLNIPHGAALTVASTNIATDGDLIGGGPSGSNPAFTNAGTFRKSAGPGVYALFPGLLFNSVAGSVIQVDSGTLQLPGSQGILDSVTFNTAPNTVVDLVGGDTAIAQGVWSSGTGAGTVRLSANQLSDNYRAPGSTCTFNFPGDVFQWTGGTIGGTGSGEVPLFYNTGVVNLSGDGTKFSQAFINNKGLMIQSGAGNLDIFADTLTNAAGATYDLRSDAGIVTTYYGQFTNIGLLKKSSGAGTSAFTTAFNNQGGTIEVDSGTLQLPNAVNSDNGTNTGGVFNVAANSLLDLGSGARFTGTYTGSGAGVVRFNAGTLQGNYRVDGSSTVFNFPAGLFQWTGGTIGDYPTEPFANNGTITLVGGGDKQLNNTFTNNGVIIHNGTGALSRPALFTNAAGALYDIQADVSIGDNGPNYTVPFTNAGSFQKSGGAGVSSVGENFANTGTVSVQTGTLDFHGSISGLSSGTLTQGTWVVADGATLQFSNYPDGITVNGADVTLVGVSSKFPAIDSLTDNQGNFSLLGQRQFTTTGDLASEGVITLDAGSTLHVSGNFTASDTAAPRTSGRSPTDRQTMDLAETGSVLHVIVGGTATQGAESAGLLQVAHAAKLAGRLEIALNALVATPSASDTVTVLSAEAISGGFSNVASGARLKTSDSRGSFVVTASAASSNRVVLSAFLPAGHAAPTIPTVTFVVPGSDKGKATITEGGPKLKILASRTGDDLSQPVTISYKAIGTAIAGVDYKPMSGTVTIPAGSATAKVKILAYPDGVADGTKVLKLKLQPSDTYILGTVSKVKLTILDADRGN